jgi:hypothetical protein
MVAIFKNYLKFMIHMRIKPLKLKKEKKSYKKFLPIVLTVLMLGSGLIAFTYSTPTSDKMKLTVVTWNDYVNNYDIVVSNEFDYIEGISALDLLRMANVNVVYTNDTVECISAYCNYEKFWEFYVNNQMQVVSPEFYSVQKGDEIIFAYK